MKKLFSKNLPFCITFILLFLFLGAKPAISQVVPDSMAIQATTETRLENSAEQSGSEPDFEDLLINAEYYLRHPLNLNNAGQQELASLGFLNELQISNLLEYRSKFGKLLSVYELQAIDGFSPEIIGMMLPYVSTGQAGNLKFNFRDMLHHGDHLAMIRYQQVIEKQKGYTERDETGENRYLGSPYRLYFKYRYNYLQKIKIGITAEKDAGEMFFRGTNPLGFDFYSGYISINRIGILRQSVMGDYNLQFGQGLCLWSGLSYGLSSDFVAIKKIATGVTPYNSAYENAFMRGAAFTLEFGPVNLSLFYSRKMLDGDLSTDSSGILPMVETLYEDGLHNTPAKALAKDAIKEQIFGGHASYRRQGAEIGLTAYAMMLGAEIPQGDKPYQLHDFSGRTNFNIGIDYSWARSNISFFGETSISRSLGIATHNGLMINAGRVLSFSVSYRYYQINHHSFYASPFGQGSRPANENGLYLGVYLRINHKFQLGGWADFYRFPWLKYRVNGPSSGQDYSISATYKPARTVVADLRYRYSDSRQNSGSDSSAIRPLVNINRQSLRLNISCLLVRGLTSTTRTEITRNRPEGQKAAWGYMFYQDFRYHPLKIPFGGSVRFTVFDCEDWETRIYAREGDVLNAFSMPALSSRGIRWYVLLHYRPLKYITIYVRFAQTYYDNKSFTGSGLGIIQGNRQSEIKAEIKFSF